MSLKIAVIKETAAGEHRVAASPETVKKLSALKAQVHVEAGAGNSAALPDSLFTEAGAVVGSRTDILKDAQVILCVQPPALDDLKNTAKGALLIGNLNPYKNGDYIAAAAAMGIDCFAMELVPRITRAQAMDVLSSQANLAGYKAVLEAAAQFGRAFPMMMTAAGTVPPAKVFIMGAGVAGLQAIATARRLGAVVSATDVRPASKEQVASLGATFIAVEDDEFKQAETSGGYAKEMSPEYKAKQQKLVEDTIAKQDIVITTALIPGRPAPKLITAAMVASMKPGSVIVDMAVEQGGNCELSVPGEVTVKNGVTIVGYSNLASRLAASAALLYAKNLLSLLTLVIDKETGTLKINAEDDIIKGVALTRAGAVIHPQFAKAA